VADLRVLLVDDEPLVRQGIRDFLAAEPDIAIIGECGNGLEALEIMAREPVDLVFLDVQMPELDGLGVAAALSGQGGPEVVFVTAYSEHAVRAFEVNAVDYVLKPFDRERFAAALARVRARRTTGEREELARRLATVLAELQQAQGHAQRVVVRSEGRIRLVAVDDIDWIEAADNYARLHAGPERHLIRETMTSLEARLDPARFARIHRSTIVNLDRIRELQPTFNGEYAVLLHTGAKLTLSRGYRDALRERLGSGW
jgi:two-component system, LytTR family, response regulator